MPLNHAPPPKTPARPQGSRMGQVKEKLIERRHPKAGEVLRAHRFGEEL